jgi:DNA polymerase-3 subunit epsilon
MRRRLIPGLLGRITGVSRVVASRVAARPTPEIVFPADEPLSTLPVVVLDTETTGLSVHKDRLVAIGGLQCRGGHPEPSPPLDYLVHPGIKIPPRATNIHGITNERVAFAPSFPLIWPSIQLFWHRRVLVGHNIAFDLAILRHEAERAGLSFHPPAAALDVGMLYAGLKPRMSMISLDTVAQDLGVEISFRHSAIGDAEAAAAIWAQLLPALSRLGVATLGAAQKLMAKQRDLIHGQSRAGWAVDLLLPHRGMAP